MCKLMDDLWLNGKEEGKEEGMKEIALSMIRKHLPFELISECTGLSVTEVEELSKPRTA